MNELTIPYHLAIPSALCIVGLLIIFLKREQLFKIEKRRGLWINIIIFIGLYLLIVSGATCADIYYQWDLNRYDIDKDGFFGGTEITEDQQAAMQSLTNDVGRNFSFITGLFFSFLVSGAVYLTGRIGIFKKTGSA